MPQISVNELINLLPADPLWRDAAVLVVVLTIVVALAGVWALVDLFCTYSDLPVLNGDGLPPLVEDVHHAPPKSGTCAKGFIERRRLDAPGRRQQLDALVQIKGNAKCVAYIGPDVPWGISRSEGWR